MNDLQIFNYGGNEVRTIEQNGEPWFVLKDVCEVLGLSDTNKTAERLDADELTRIKLVSGGQEREMYCINEPGLYNVILRSDKPEAKPFRKWVTTEVLPSIRKHGAYMTPETLQAALLNPDTMISLCQQLKAAQDENKALQVTNSALAVDKQIMQPKAEYFDQIVDRNLLTGVYETAKQLNVSPKKFVAFLQAHKYMYHDKRGKLMAYANYIDAGLFELKECINEKTKWSGTQTLITPKGRETFRLLCQGL